VTQIAVTGLRVPGRHGVYPEERRAGQEFVVDAVLTTGPVAGDDLAGTVDYGTVAADLAGAVAGPPVALLETLADRLLDVCLADPRVDAAEVTVHKPEAPIGLPFADVAVTVRRARPAVLALGSNLGDRLAHLRAAVDLLQPDAVSPVYETVALGGPPQPDYLNAVLLLPARQPAALLALGQAVERCRGRERTQRWGPRTLDVDVIAVGARTVTAAGLTLPHPRAQDRAFVLAPWHDVDPAAVLPGHGPVAVLLAAADRTGLRRRDELRLTGP
jgi:dihydroneopterin aldolase/2-amino-4-hydroxy-6-hydroxymethyldihydropteridine diphosphokinase